MNYFEQVWQEVSARYQARDVHRASCTKRPCDECEIYVCPRCKGAMYADEGGAYSVGEQVRSGVCNRCVMRDQREHMLSGALASVPKRYRWARFEAPELNGRAPHSGIEQAKAALKSSRVTLIGQAGSGKTSLAVAMLRTKLDAGLEPNASHVAVDGAARAMFVSSFDLTDAGTAPRTFLKAGERDDGDPLRGVSPFLVRAMTASVLVLDELGSEANPEVVKKVLHKRHDDEAPTWVTTFLTKREVGQRYGGGIERRLFEKARVIDLSVPALRAVAS
jgi:DNA replication protein DnaC